MWLPEFLRKKSDPDLSLLPLDELVAESQRLGAEQDALRERRRALRDEIDMRLSAKGE